MARLKTGFRFSEVMGGTYSLTSKPKETRRFEFLARMEAPSLSKHLRDGGMTLEGTLEMDGFADAVPIEGRLTMLPFTRKLIRYEFAFTANDGKPYRFAGQKDIKFTKLRKTFTTLPGSVFDADDREIATALTYFDARTDLLQFLSSWRPA